ncbi:hypothetical protein LCGC14_0175950 [marine sediment metagenome]|uniref:Uncharacterized protein n=1 Tax=marine sediment metagenome TaxID=412755 RepID=A0A0F9X9R4_9ZZZZ
MSEQDLSNQKYEAKFLGEDVGQGTDGWADRGAAMSIRADATLHHFKDIFWYKIIFENSKMIKRIFQLILLGIIIYIIVVAFQTGDAGIVLDRILSILIFIFELLFGIIKLFFTIFFTNIYTAFPFWVFAITRSLIILLMSQQHGVFMLGWFEPPKTFKQVIFHKYLDDASRPYIGIRTSFWRRLLWGIERYPLHEDLYANFTNQLNIEIQEVAPSSGAVEVFTGTGIILIDPDLEDGEPIDVNSIFRIIERPSGEEGMVYRAAYADLDHAAPVAFLQSVFYGQTVEYWRQYSDEREKRMEMEAELQYQQYGGHLKKLKEFYPSAEGMASEYLDEDWIDPDSFRFFDNVKERQRARKEAK